MQTDNIIFLVNNWFLAQEKEKLKQAKYTAKQKKINNNQPVVI
jgi:hypothetical protein